EGGRAGGAERSTSEGEREDGAQSRTAEGERGAAAQRRPAEADPRRGVGRRGEELALAHFRALGFRAVARNHRTRHGEIDLIVFDGRTLVFVEVKSRVAGRDGNPSQRPLHALRGSQRRRLRRLSLAWLQETPSRPRAAEIRFDAVGIVLDRHGEPLSLEHLEGVL
ncbi:MAG TPA: YraN family protein, partial [Polyangia bacterium]